jgi:integrase
MTLQRFSPHTQRNYIAAVKGLADFYKKSPDLLTNDQIQNYFRYLIEDRKLAWGSCNNHFSGISCFCRNILKWEETKFKIPPRPRTRQLPIIISEEEAKRLFDAVDNLKHKVILKTVYSAGLRLSEVIRLKPEHIESDPSRMMIRIEQGKGKKDRYTILARSLLPELREYWRKYKPGEWLFPGQNRKNHISPSAVYSIFQKAKKSRYKKRPGYSHPSACLCHSFAFPRN